MNLCVSFLFMQSRFIWKLLILLSSPGSVATGLGIGGIASNAGAGQGGLGSIAAADTLAAHGSHNFGIGHPCKDLVGDHCQILLLILSKFRPMFHLWINQVAGFY